MTTPWRPVNPEGPRCTATTRYGSPCKRLLTDGRCNAPDQHAHPADDQQHHEPPEGTMTERSTEEIIGELISTQGLIVGLDERGATLGAIVDELPLAALELIKRLVQAERNRLIEHRQRYDGGRLLDAEADVLKMLFRQLLLAERMLRRDARVAAEQAARDARTVVADATGGA